MSETAKLFGIDLGTTYSCISYLDDTGRPVVCPSLEGENTTPSVVRIMPEEDAPVAGRNAKDMAVLYADYTIQFVKSKIGRVDSFEYGPENDRHTTTPVDVSAEILKKLANDAGQQTNTKVKDVVITVPAYFGANEKAATKEAGEKAGLNVVNIVEEPTAAAFFYGCQNSDKEETVCIYDLGGGTFDVTAMKLGNGSLEVITTDGNHDLGGKNWDEEMLSIVEEKFREQTGYEDEFDIDILQDLQIRCENAKKQLSQTNTTNIAISIDRNNRANITVTREEFDARTATLLAQSIDLTRTVFERVKEKGEKIDKILLVGGSTFMPQVKEALVEEFGIEPELNDPNEAVSKGACIYCAWSVANKITAKINGDADEDISIGGDTVTDVVQNDDGTQTITIESKPGVFRQISVTLDPAIKNTVIKTVATKSFGIRVRVNGEPKIANLIKKDTLLPVDITRTFGTATEDMRNVSIELFQSTFYEDHYEIDEGDNIGESVLDGLPAGLPAGSPVDLTITLDEAGLLKITGAYNGMPLEGKLEANYADNIGQQ